jgi:hypothetical protein
MALPSAPNHCAINLHSFRKCGHSNLGAYTSARLQAIAKAIVRANLLETFRGDALS